jgi:hypothetical protein
VTSASPAAGSPGAAAADTGSSLVIGLLVIVAVILFVAVFAVANRGRGASPDGP